MSTYKRICITDRELAGADFSGKIRNAVESNADVIILRDKLVVEEEYATLAKEVIDICQEAGKECILHSFILVARKLNHPYIHLTMDMLRNLSESDQKFFTTIGASCHSVEDALEAERLGATYITASHIYRTDCKKGLEPRGISFLNSVVSAVNIPVYALGGIHEDNIMPCIEAGASGVCMMSEYMKGKEEC